MSNHHCNLSNNFSVLKSILFTVLFFVPFTIFAQNAVPSAIATPEQPGAIYLYKTPKAGKPQEQWESIGGGRIIRNVVSPTITPFFPEAGIATGAAVIIAPGGAFRLLAIDHEGYDVARWFAAHGITAFLLKYRVEETPRPPAEYVSFMNNLMGGFMKEINGGHFQPQTPAAAAEDAAAAVRLVRSRASEWKVNQQRIGIVGFSAGALMAVNNAVSTDTTGRANFIGSPYGQLVLKPVPADAPPMFAGMASNDPLSGQGGFDVITAWQKAGRSVELHLYAQGGHGFGIRQQGTTSDLWKDQFVFWLKCIGMLNDKK